MTALYEHKIHPHRPQNANWLHAEQIAERFNTRLAVRLTRLVSAMPTAYLFTVLSLIGLFGLLGLLSPFVFLLTTWLSQQFLQLVFLPILAVGQNVLNQKQEIQSDETFSTTQKIDHDLTELRRHLDAQDAKILTILKHLEARYD